MLDGTLLNDRYLIQTELGRGGMGIVYRATDTLLHRPVAVKVVTAAGLGTEGRTRLLHEARAAASLNHPNIVFVYDAGETRLPGEPDRRSFIVMELVEGRPLRSVRPASMEEVVDVMGQVCAALGHAHQRGIIHRDLKPENVFLTPAGLVKLVDFGLAQSPDIDKVGEIETISGTLLYLAPEIILGQPATISSDLYALGVMFYELLTARQPYEGEDLSALLSQRLYASAAPPSAYDDRIPTALDALVLQLLKREPEERPASAGQVVEMLAKWQLLQSQNMPALNAAFPPLARLAKGRLVGRENELSQAMSLWQQAAAGEGQWLLVSGEPGIGKTRFVHELMTYAGLKRGLVLESQCYPETGVPYLPFGQVIRELLERPLEPALPDSLLQVLLTLAPELRLSHPELTAGEPPESEADRQRLFECVVTLFDRFAEQRPLMLFVDDLHWADSGTLLLLRHLARRLRTKRLMLVGTYREIDLEASRPLQSMLPELRRERLAYRIKLPRLNREQTGAMLATLFATEITEDFLAGIYRETEGNPFFIEEVCKGLVESGKLYFASGRWHRPGMAELEIPQGIQAAIESRLEALSAQEMEMLQFAALLGREFQYEMLLAVLQYGREAGAPDEERVIAGLERAEVGQLIAVSQPAGGGPKLSFSFTHALIQATLLSGLSALRRQRLQRRVALALELAYPTHLKEMAPMLGRYFAEAGEGEKAIFYLLQNGDAAFRLFAYEEAATAYEQALLFLREQPDQRQTARTLMKLGLAYHNTFNFDQAHKAYEEGFKLWRQTPARRAQPLPVAPHALRLNLRQPQTLDPARSAHLSSGLVIQQLFSGLVRHNADGELVPDVAQSWEVLDGGRRYIFHLRDDVHWSDGRPVTAGDFEFGWKRALDPSAWPFPGELLYDIRGARDLKAGRLDDPAGLGLRILDERTLLIDLQEPAGYFLQLLANTVAMPLPRHVVAARGEAWTDPDHIVTNGPFRLLSWQPDQSLTLGRYAGYHGAFHGNLKYVAAFFSEAAEAWRMYRAGDLDSLQLGPLFPPALHERVRQQHAGEYIGLPTPTVCFLTFDVTRPPFDNPLLRRAFALALDKEGLAGVVLKGLYPPAGGGFVPPGMPGHVADIGLPHDPDRARSLLAQAGFPDGSGLPALEMRRLQGDIYTEIAAALAETWRRQLGVECYSEPLQRGKNAHIYLTTVGPDCPDPDSFLRVNNWSLASGWHDPDFEGLIERARRLPDLSDRLAMYRRAESILVQQAALVPLHYGRAHMLLKPWVSRYPTTTLGAPLWQDVVLETH